MEDFIIGTVYKDVSRVQSHKKNTVVFQGSDKEGWRPPGLVRYPRSRKSKGPAITSRILLPPLPPPLSFLPNEHTFKGVTGAAKGNLGKEWMERSEG